MRRRDLSSASVNTLLSPSSSSNSNISSSSNNKLAWIFIKKKFTMVRRVRSRQRLSSSDAFDAVSESSTYDDLPRKHEDSQVSLSTTQSLLSLLPDDVTLHVGSFLSSTDTNSWMQTNRNSRRVLSDPVVWRNYMERQWPFLKNDGMSRNKTTRFVHQLTTAASNSSSANAMTSSTTIASFKDIPQLLRLACHQQSTSIDESTFSYSRLPSRQLLVRRNGLEAAATSEPVLKTRALMDGSKAIQYTGPIGHGDRSIRANQPLARPTEWLLHPRRRRRFSLRDTICRTLLSTMPDSTACRWRPFTSPFMQPDGSINVTPRLVSYYEVSILADASNDVTSSDDNDAAVSGSLPAPPRPPAHANNNLPTTTGSTEECVAVGLAGCRFYCTTRMPGWDKYSFGYHGDDGGFFHGSGSMRQQYGPRFGRGDVVGCGVDYANNTIFFTLNGKSLGNAMECVFDDSAEHVGLYPVVGLDSSSLVSCNFLGPFQFDLSAYSHKQASKVQAAMSQRKVVVE